MLGTTESDVQTRREAGHQEGARGFSVLEKLHTALVHAFSEADIELGGTCAGDL